MSLGTEVLRCSYWSWMSLDEDTNNNGEKIVMNDKFSYT